MSLHHIGRYMVAIQGIYVTELPQLSNFLFLGLGNYIKPLYPIQLYPLSYPSTP